nr:hypothetical protein CFP56_12359 [Quercus suber]
MLYTDRVRSDVRQRRVKRVRLYFVLQRSDRVRRNRCCRTVEDRAALLVHGFQNGRKCSSQNSMSAFDGVRAAGTSAGVGAICSYRCMSESFPTQSRYCNSPKDKGYGLVSKNWIILEAVLYRSHEEILPGNARNFSNYASLHRTRLLPPDLIWPINLGYHFEMLPGPLRGDTYANKMANSCLLSTAPSPWARHTSLSVNPKRNAGQCWQLADSRSRSIVCARFNKLIFRIERAEVRQPGCCKFH